jgi:hypothetical protein
MGGTKAATGGSVAKGGTGGIDTGFPTGGKAGLGGQYTVDYGVLVGGGSAIDMRTGGNSSTGGQPIIAPAYGVIPTPNTGGGVSLD